MKMPLTRAALTTLATLVAVVAPAAAATADSLTVKDATGDTWQLDMSAETESYTPAGSHLNTDLKRTVVKHTRDRLVVRATYAELKKSGPKMWFAFQVRTNEGLKRVVGVDTMESARGTAHFEKPNGDQPKCRDLRHTVDYTGNRVTVSVPRSCLSAPRWVQLQVMAVSMDADMSEMYVENGHNATHNEPKTWTARIRRG